MGDQWQHSVLRLGKHLLRSLDACRADGAHTRRPCPAQGPAFRQRLARGRHLWREGNCPLRERLAPSARRPQIDVSEDICPFELTAPQL